MEEVENEEICWNDVIPNNEEAWNASLSTSSLLDYLIDLFVDNTPPSKPTPSGLKWCAKFSGSTSLDDLSDEKNFRDNINAFIEALKVAEAIEFPSQKKLNKAIKKKEEKAGYTITATLRPKERSYLMHYSWKIFNGMIDYSKEIESFPGVNIIWWHEEGEKKSKDAAKEMVIGYKIRELGIPPALDSNHNKGKAIDLVIRWRGNLNIKKRDGTDVIIKTTPRNHTNRELIQVAKSYDVEHFKCSPRKMKRLKIEDPWDKICVNGDRPHWSYNGF